jgi:hypothetical protein
MHQEKTGQEKKLRGAGKYLLRKARIADGPLTGEKGWLDIFKYEEEREYLK